MLRPTGSETCGKLTNEQENTRNYGIDLLRIVSMFMVCLLHVLGNGGVLLAAAPQSVNFYVAEYVEIAAFCAVDCYALISGYIGIKSKYKVSNIISLWLQVVLYSVAISVSFVVLKPDTYTLETVIKSFFPVTFSRYWYFTAYFGLFLFKPLLDSALNSLSERQIRYSLIIIVLTFSILTIPNTRNLFQLNGGYSVLWLIVLYLVGGYISKYKPLKNIKSKTCVLALFALVFLVWLSRLCIEFVTLRLFGEAKWGGAFISYLSPFIFCVAVIMLELFSRLRFKNRPRFIAFFAPLTFGVYLIHEHEFISSNLIFGRFADFASYNPVLMVLAVLGTAAGIFAVCSLIDYLRLLLFKILKVKPTLEKLENKLKNKIFKEEGNV